MTETTPQGLILTGVDGTENSAQALRWAVRQAAATGATVRVVACWEWPPGAGVGTYYDLSALTREAAESVVDKVVADLGLPDQPPVEVAVVEGYPARVLVEAAHGADLLVVGSRGRSTIGSVLLGSVGLHCATHAPCPVVIVRGTPAGSSPPQ